MKFFNGRPPKSRRERKKFRWNTATVLALVLTGVIALAAAAVFLPAGLAWLDGTTPTADIIQANRQALLWMAGGLIAVVTLLLAGFRDRTSRQKLDLDRDANFTARYTEAVAQLGSEKIAIRLGGIYALERIAVDSKRDRPTIIQVLAAYVRLHVAIPDKVAEDRPEDVTAALQTLYRLNRVPRTERINLATSNLSGEDLTRANLRNADLTEADLRNANLRNADLTEADLRNADLRNADLRDVHLRNANLTWAVLAYALLWNANLTDAKGIGVALWNADLTDADLTGADLTGANLTGANLTGANLTGANLRRVRWDSHTVWPDGFEPPPSV